MASSSGPEGAEVAAALATGEAPSNLSELCTCTVSTVTFRFERSDDCPIHERPRVTYDSMQWERIPEPTVCICADVKGVHRREPHGGATRCGSGNAPAFRAIAQRLEQAEKRKDPHPREAGALPPAPVLQGCRCPGFHDVDAPLAWLSFTDRLLGEFDTGAPAMETIEHLEKGAVRVMERNPARPNAQARARTALVWAWKASGLQTHEPVRTWNQWLADSKRVWRAWREAGSPIKAFGQDRAFGPIAISVLEDR